MNNIATNVIEDEFKRPKKYVSYQYVRGLTDMAYYLNHISGDERASLIKRAEQFIK